VFVALLSYVFVPLLPCTVCVCAAAFLCVADYIYGTRADGLRGPSGRPPERAGNRACQGREQQCAPVSSSGFEQVEEGVETGFGIV